MRESLNEEIKARVPESIKFEILKIADRRHLDMSDVVREALRDYVAKCRADGAQMPAEEFA